MPCHAMRYEYEYEEEEVLAVGGIINGMYGW